MANLNRDEIRADPAQTPKPRWGRRARMAAGLLLLAVVLFGGHSLWSVAANRKLARVVEEYRRRGEPMLPGDFEQPPLADAENAVVDLRAAAALINCDDPRYEAWGRLSPAPVPPLTEAEAAALKAAVEANQAALDKLDAAKPKTGVDWGNSFRSPVVMGTLPDLNQQRQLAQLLSQDALYAHQAGDDARAVRRLWQVLYIGRAVDRQPFLVCHLGSVGISEIASVRAGQIAPTLKVAPAREAAAATSSSVPPRGPAPADEVEGLIGELLSYDAGNAGLARAMRGERMMQLDAVQAVLDGKIGYGMLSRAGSAPAWASLGTAGGRVLRPMMLKDARLMIAYTSDLAAAVSAPDWQTAKTRVPPYPSELTKNRIAHPIAADLISSKDRSFLHQYRGSAVRRLAATSLAVRLYADQHDGKLPATLDDLLPAYLPSVPADPMGVNRPLGYVRGDGGGGATGHVGDPIVYSVGDDGADDGGSEQPDSLRRIPDENDPWDRRDIVLHLRQRERKNVGAVSSPQANGAGTQPGTQPASP